MGQAAVDRALYCRRLVLSYQALEEMLALPDGFKIDRIVTNSPEYQALVIFVQCPHKMQWAVPLGQVIPAVWDCTQHVNSQGIVDKIWWPSLGQVEPAAPVESELLDVLSDLLTWIDYDEKESAEPMAKARELLTRVRASWSA